MSCGNRKGVISITSGVGKIRLDDFPRPRVVLAAGERSQKYEKNYDFSKIPDDSVEDGCNVFYCIDHSVYEFSWPRLVDRWQSSPLLDRVAAELNYILLTNDNALASCLICTDFQIENKCLIVLGSADKATCYFLRVLKARTKLPIYALVDFDPVCLKLLSFYETWDHDGNMPLHLARVSLDINWLGVRPFSQGLSQDAAFVEMNDEEVAMAEELPKFSFFKDHPDRLEEVHMMLRYRFKVPIAAVRKGKADYVLELIQNEI